MKQLQWDKLPVAATSRTVWSEDPAVQSEREREMLAKLSEMSIWAEMEEDFKAKQLVINLMGEFESMYRKRLLYHTNHAAAKQKKADLKSVLDPQTKKRVGAYIVCIRATI